MYVERALLPLAGGATNPAGKEEARISVLLFAPIPSPENVISTSAWHNE